MPFFLRHVVLALLVLPLLAGAAGAQAEGPDPKAAADGASQPGYAAMADILEDEAARNALIAQLRRLAAGQGAEAASPAEQVPLARRIASATNGLIEEIAAEAAEAYRRILSLQMDSVSSQGVAGLAQATFDLGVLVAVVAVVMWLSRLAAGGLYRRIAGWAARAHGSAHWMRRGLATLGAALIDLAAIAIGWLAGHGVALLALGEQAGRMDASQSFFLNAFLVVETAKVAIRLFFSTRHEDLRLLPVTAEDAAYWESRASHLASLLGYGILVVEPIVELNLGTALGFVTGAVVYGLALALIIVVVRQNREPVRQGLRAMAERSRTRLANVLLGTLSHIWHIVAIAYAAVLALLLLLRPESALSFIIGATLQTILAVAVGVLLSILIDRAMALGIRLKPQTRVRFPMLEERLNAFVPAALRGVRVFIALLVAAVVLDAWRIVDFFAWIRSESGLNVIGTIVTIAFVLAAAFAIWLFVSSWIEHRLNQQAEADSMLAASRARQRTLLTIFRNAFTIALVVMALMVTLSELGLDIGPLLAGAGVLGLAIGFGAQKLVQDVITGVFIQLENAIYTGDVVSASGITGVVEKLTIRSVGIRDLSGTYHIIPFSSVDTVSNFMRGFSYHVGEYGVAYRENVDEVIEVMRQAFEELRENPEHAASIIDDLEVHGVTAFADSSVNVRIRIKTLPGQQWAVGRAYNAIIKKRFDAAGIEIPFPHVTLYFGEDKKGSAPPAPIRIVEPQSVDGGDMQSKAEPRKPQRRKTARRKPPQPAEGGQPDLPSEEEL